MKVVSSQYSLRERKKMYRREKDSFETKITEHNTEVWETSKPKVADGHKIECKKAEVAQKKENMIFRNRNNCFFKMQIKLLGTCYVYQSCA